MGIITHNKENKYVGWLGNRMFMYASSIGIATKNNMPYAFPKHEYMDAFKGDFHVDNNVSSLNAIDYEEPNFHYTDVVLNPNCNYNLLGYWQSEKYFKHCEPLIRELFTFNDEIRTDCANIIQQTKDRHLGKDIISIHFRFGDFMTLKENYVCLTETDYYQKAIASFDKQNTVFIVFSDDKKMAFEFMKQFDVEWFAFEEQTAAKDMCLISMCKDGGVNANSSFSWWSDYLGQKKISIFPKKDKWFGKKYAHWNVDYLYLDSWTLV